MNFQSYQGGGNPLGFGFGKAYGTLASGEESPHRRMRRPPGSVRLPPVEGAARSVSPPQGRYGSASSGPAPSPMRASQLGSSMVAQGGGGGGGGGGYNPNASGYSSLDSSFTSHASGGLGGGSGGGGGGGGSSMDFGQLMRFVEARLSMEQSLREGVMREVGKLRDSVAGLERERDEARGAAEHLRGRQAMLAQELGLLRDRVESGGMRSELASLHARVEMLQREVGQVLAAHAAGGGSGGSGDMAARSLQMGQRDVLALVEAEARSRQAAEEALSGRVLGLQRSVAELQQAAAAAAAAAAQSPRRKGGRGGGGGEDADNALDVRTVVTKPILETYLSGIRAALEGEGAARAREGQRLEATFSAALDRAGAQIAGLRGGLQEEFAGRVESVVSAVTGAVADLSARSREHASALSDHASSLAGLAGGLEEDRRGVREALAALREGLQRRADAGEAALAAQTTAWARKEAALGDALLRGLQREEAARVGSTAQLAAGAGALAERLEEVRRGVEAGASRASSGLEALRRSLEGVVEARVDVLKGALEDVSGRVSAEKTARGFALKQLEGRLSDEAERLSAEIGELRERGDGGAGEALARVAGEVAGLGARLGEERRERGEALEALAGQVGENLSAAREALSVRIKAVEGALDTLSAADGALAERVEEVAAGIEATTAKLSVQINGISGDLGKDVGQWANTMQGEMEAALAALNGKVRANVESLSALSSDVERVKGEAEGRKQTLDDLTRNLGALRASVSEAAPALANVEALAGEVTAMHQRIHSMEANVASVGDKLGSVAEAVGSGSTTAATMAASLEELKASAAAQREAVAGMQAGMAGLEQARAGNEGKLAALSSGLESLKAHMGESQAGVEAALGEVRARLASSAAAEADIVAALGKLESGGASAAATLSSLSGSVAALKEASAEAKAEGARALAEQVRVLKEEAAGKERDMAAVLAGLDSVSAKTRATEAAVKVLEQGLGEVQAAAGTPGEAFSALNAQVSGLVDSAKAREGAVASLGESLEALKAAAAARAATVERVERELAALAGEARGGLAELRGEASAHSGSVAELKSHLAGLNAALDAAKSGDAEAARKVQSELAAMGGRMSGLESGVGEFSSKLGKEVAELRSGAGDNSALKAQLDALKAQTERTSKEVAEAAQEIASLRDKAAPPSVTGAAALEKDAIVGVVNEAMRPEMGKLGAKVKSVETSVKTFSEKLGNDVEVWQAAVNSELQAALGKVKEQLKLHGDDVEVLKKNQETLGSALAAASASEKEAVGKRIKGVEESVKAFSTKLGGDVEAWQKQMNAELQAAVAKVRETVKSNHDEVAKLAEEVGAIKGGGAGGGGAAPAGAAAGAGGGGAAAGAEVAAMGKKIKAVEESVKSFSTKLGGDVEAWQQAINTELQAALTKVKEQVHRNADVVGKCQRDVDALAAGRPPSAKGGEGGAGKAEAGAAGGGGSSGSGSSGAEAAAIATMTKRIKVLEATLSAHEMALQAHTETLEAHASWLENIDSGFGEEEAPAAAAPGGGGKDAAKAKEDLL